MSARRLLASLVLFALPCGAAAQSATQLVTVSDGLYRFQDGERAGIVYVAEDAILIADPLSTRVGRALREELATRFPGKRVEYIVNTSHDYARAAGSAIFPSATFVAHRLFNAQLRRAARRLPDALGSVDANGNGRLDAHEWTQGDDATIFASADHNKDRVITSGEAFSLIPLVKGPFLSPPSLLLGGRKVEIVNPGDLYSTFALYFPEARVLYTGVNPAFAGSGFSFGDVNPRALIAWLDGIANVPFEHVVTGYGDVLTRADVLLLAERVEVLMRSAVDAYIRGLSPEAAAAMPAARNTGPQSDGSRRANIASIFRSLRVTRTELHVAAMARWMSPNNDYCSGYDSCGMSDRIAGGSVGVSLMRSRAGLVLELSFAEQFQGRRDRDFDGEAFAHRSSRGSLLFRYGAARPSARSIDLLLGGTLNVADTRGITQVKQSVAPLGGRHPFTERKTRFAFTAGTNLVAPVTRAISITVPVRVTMSPLSPEPRWPGPVDVQGGVGVTFRLRQRVR